MVQEKERYSSNSGIYQNNLKKKIFLFLFYLEFCGMHNYMGCVWTGYCKGFLKRQITGTDIWNKKKIISIINQLDAQNFCFTISLFHASTCFEHMCSKHVELWNKLIVKQKFCASIWFISKINILRCTVSKTSTFEGKFWFKCSCPASAWLKKKGRHMGQRILS